MFNNISELEKFMEKPKFNDLWNNHFIDYSIIEVVSLLDIYREFALFYDFPEALELTYQIDRISKNINNGESFVIGGYVAHAFPEIAHFNTLNMLFGIGASESRGYRNAKIRFCEAVLSGLDKESDKVLHAWKNLQEKSHLAASEEKELALLKERLSSVLGKNNYLDQKTIAGLGGYYEYSSQKGLKMVLQLKDFIASEYKKRIENRSITLNSDGILLFPEIAQYYSIIEIDKILLENGLDNYGIYEVTRSNHPDISNGTKFYSFNENDDLVIMDSPYKIADFDGAKYLLFESLEYKSSKIITIPKNEIVSYKLYGSELMQSTVSTNYRPNEADLVSQSSNGEYLKPSITGTLFSTFIFGSTYTILNGVGKLLNQQTNLLGNKLDGIQSSVDKVIEAINSISITTNHKIIDTSRVQIILTDRRDLEIDGINIYYDLNRVYPNIDNKSGRRIEEIDSKSSSSLNVADELLKLKQLHDQGVIDDEEFKVLKSKLLSQ